MTKDTTQPMEEPIMPSNDNELNDILHDFSLVAIGIIKTDDDYVERTKERLLKWRDTHTQAEVERAIPEKYDPKLSETDEEYAGKEWYNQCIDDIRDNLKLKKGE